MVGTAVKHDDSKPNHASSMRTICEVLREINDLHQGWGDMPASHDEKVRALLREAQTMAKKMARKLLEHNKEVFAEWWAKNPDYEADLKRRMAKDYLT